MKKITEFDTNYCMILLCEVVMLSVVVTVYSCACMWESVIPIADDYCFTSYREGIKI